jgi:homoserine kinase type II
MSVYTTVDDATLRDWLKRYRLGPLEAFAGIAGGVENTNYFVDTGSGRYVLTLFERLTSPEASRYLELMAHLATARVSCPRPMADRDGHHLGMLCGKPAAVVSRLPGQDVAQPSPSHCAAIGGWLATMHAAQGSFAPRWPNPRGAAWRATAAGQVRGFLDPSQRSLLDAALAAEGLLARRADLPRGIVHADLFRDNALFADAGNAVLGGVIDFYFAGDDALLFDLAVVANDWCTDDSRPIRARERALLAAYEAKRPLTAGERAAWPAMRQLAALRFWLSRLLDAHAPREGAMVLTKDPLEYERLLGALLADDDQADQS